MPTKAFTSRAFDVPTRELGGLGSPQSGPAFGIHTTNGGRVVIFPGGVPLQHGGTIVGAVGVSGGLPPLSPVAWSTSGGTDTRLAGGAGRQPSGRRLQAVSVSTSRPRVAWTSIAASTAPRMAWPQVKYRRGVPVPPVYSRVARLTTLATSAGPGPAAWAVYSPAPGAPVIRLSRKAATMSSSHRRR